MTVYLYYVYIRAKYCRFMSPVTKNRKDDRLRDCGFKAKNDKKKNVKVSVIIFYRFCFEFWVTYNFLMLSVENVIF